MTPHQTQCYLASVTHIKYSDKGFFVLVPRLELGNRYRRLPTARCTESLTAYCPVAVKLLRGFGRCHEACAGMGQWGATDEHLFHLYRLDVEHVKRVQRWGTPSQVFGPQCIRVNNQGRNTQSASSSTLSVRAMRVGRRREAGTVRMQYFVYCTPQSSRANQLERLLSSKLQVATRWQP